MEHLIENISWLQENDYLRGFVFGLVHTIIPLIGFYSGWSVNRLLKIASNDYIAGIFGIVLGGLIPLTLVPIFDKYIVKSKHHIVVGDHDDLKKDLEEHHH